MKTRYKVLIFILVAMVIALAGYVMAYKLEPTAAYDTLTTSETYRGFTNAICSFKEEYTFDSLDDVKDAYDELAERHPEIFWLDNEYTYSVNANETVTVAIQYRMSHIAAKIKKIFFDITFHFLVEKVKTLSGDYNKVKYVHDYLVDNLTYDGTDAFSGTAYGALTYGSAVCSGYADAARMLLMAAGVECGVVYGEAGGEKHAWNYVHVNSDYHMMDVCWDDPVTGAHGEDRYKYFLISTNKMAKDHLIYDRFYLPSCIDYITD